MGNNTPRNSNPMAKNKRPKMIAIKILMLPSMLEIRIHETPPSVKRKAVIPAKYARPLDIDSRPTMSKFA